VPEEKPSELPAKKDEKALSKLRKSARELNERPGLIRAAKKTREMLPGDERVGDPLSTAADRPTDVLARYLTEVDDRPSTARELGLAAVQVFQALSEAQGRGHGERDVAILFTDLVEFSAWALKAGDADAVQLLRDVGSAVEPAIRNQKGEIVKRLGDGHMAVFTSAADAVLAAHDAQTRLRDVSAAGYKPQLRAGIHMGRPRKIGGDYLGVDVNIAARVCDAASGGQILVSGPVRDEVDEGAFELGQLRRFRAKGVPKDLDVYKATPRQA
jgi:adenylate cyclase